MITIKRELKRLLGCIRRADEDFGLIKNGDTIAIGVSGGKDSLALAYCLNLYRMFSKKQYELAAITVDIGLRPFDLEPVKSFFNQFDIPYYIERTNIGDIVFDQRKEKNPCALCANLRRGTLNNAAVKYGCNKTALGHHSEDAVATFLLSLFYEGRLNVFSPSTELSRCGITAIRPLVYAQQKDIVAIANGLPLPVVKSPCPACGRTARAKTEDIIKLIETQIPDVRVRLKSALEGMDNYKLWEKKDSTNDN